MNIGIVGSRRRDTLDDYGKVHNTFWEYEYLEDGMRVPLSLDFITIISGGCKKGADKFAKEIYNFYSKSSEIKLIEHLPQLPENYKQLSGQAKKWAYAKAAYARNKLIARDSDVLIACVAEDRTGGTENTIEWFKKLHKGKRKLILC